MVDLKGKKILVLDDEEEVLEFLGNILGREGCEAILTTSGKEAVELAKSKLPDLIILDLVVPDMLGGEVSQVLSKDPVTSAIPIIFFSGLNTKEDEKIIRDLTGRWDVLAKPVTKQEVLLTVRKILSGED